VCIECDQPWRDSVSGNKQGLLVTIGGLRRSWQNAMQPPADTFMAATGLAATEMAREQPAAMASLTRADRANSNAMPGIRRGTEARLSPGFIMFDSMPFLSVMLHLVVNHIVIVGDFLKIVQRAANAATKMPPHQAAAGYPRCPRCGLFHVLGRLPFFHETLKRADFRGECDLKR